MSRKRRQTRGSKEYGTIVYTCTGRDTHDPPAVLERVAVSFPAIPGRRGSVGTDLRCPVCGLPKRIGYKARRTLAEAGFTEVDISKLPF